MGDTTPRFALDMLYPGQAQKEMTHNEALARIDLALHACAATLGGNTPPEAPAEGDCWILGDAPDGAWQGHPRALAGWTVSGWRFLDPIEGMQVYVRDPGHSVRFVDGQWTGAPAPAIAAPAGGTVIDVEARAALAALLAAARAGGLLASA